MHAYFSVLGSRKLWWTMSLGQQLIIHQQWSKYLLKYNLGIMRIFSLLHHRRGTERRIEEKYLLIGFRCRYLIWLFAFSNMFTLYKSLIQIFLWISFCRGSCQYIFLMKSCFSSPIVPTISMMWLNTPGTGRRESKWRFVQTWASLQNFSQ